MNSFKRDRCFWIHNTPQLWFSDSFSRRIMILRFKVSKRSSVKQWEICCYVRRAEGDISWLCSILVVESVGVCFCFFWGGRLRGSWAAFALVLLKNQLKEAISSEELQSIQILKQWHHFLTWVRLLVMVERLVSVQYLKINWFCFPVYLLPTTLHFIPKSSGQFHLL